MMGKEAGVLLCSLTGMVKIHQSESSLKVQVHRPWLDKWRVSSTSILLKVPGCTNSIFRFYNLSWVKERGEEFSMSNQALITTQWNSLDIGYITMKQPGYWIYNWNTLDIWYINETPWILDILMKHPGYWIYNWNTLDIGYIDETTWILDISMKQPGYWLY